MTFNYHIYVFTNNNVVIKQDMHIVQRTSFCAQGIAVTIKRYGTFCKAIFKSVKMLLVS